VDNAALQETASICQWPFTPLNLSLKTSKNVVLDESVSILPVFRSKKHPSRKKYYTP